MDVKYSQVDHDQKLIVQTQNEVETLLYNLVVDLLI